MKDFESTRREQREADHEALLRDAFGGLALVGLLLHWGPTQHAREWAAKEAYYYADAMLAARKGGSHEAQATS